MYQDFYGLNENPFSITPDPRFLYFSPEHQAAFEHLVYGIQERKGFISLIGEVGCGKTTLCRAVLATLPETVKTALVLNPSVSTGQLIRAILMDLDIVPKGRDRLNHIDQLNRFLLEQMEANANVLVIIDEAQDLTPEVLEQVRLLNNLETDQHKLMQIVLSGQPELEKRLARPDLRQLRQRIAVHCRLHHLNEKAVAQYIAHRLQVAGARDAPRFDRGAVRMVYRETRGTPRLINRLCDNALLAGYVAEKVTIGAKEVRKAVKDIGSLL